ncbi:hypothetical protein [Streptomyces sp. NPDC050528]|uniref:hypothetical protein n=1 Tax=Streptomyces sp. NPDC050528 TaxID=3365623 RepID=UPI0037B6AB94
MIFTFVLTILIARAALWAAVSIHALWSSVGASLIMGVAVTGMHYIGITALSIQLTGKTAIDQSTSNLRFLMVMLIGPLAVLLIASTIVMFDPDMMITDDDRARATPVSRGTGSAHPMQ